MAGTFLANLLSGAAWLFTHGVYGVLKVIYHRDVAWMAFFAALVVGFVLLVRWVL